MTTWAGCTGNRCAPCQSVLLTFYKPTQRKSEDADVVSGNCQNDEFFGPFIDTCLKAIVRALPHQKGLRLCLETFCLTAKQHFVQEGGVHFDYWVLIQAFIDTGFGLIGCLEPQVQEHKP